MQFTQVVAKVGRNDARIIGRDTFLIMLFGYALFAIILIRFAVPPLANTLMKEMDFDLSVYYPLIVSGLVLHQVAAVLSGTVMGFILIDERDTGTLTAMLVTPVPPGKYILYRVMIPTVIGFVFSVLGLALLGNLHALAWWHILLLATVNAVFAALVSLFLAIFSANKVEGFATIKIVGSLMLIVMGAWFIPEPWQFIAGVYPPYWTMKSLWAIEAGESLWPLYMVIALVTQFAALAYLIRRLARVMYTT